MRGLRYFLVVLVAIAGLSLAVWLVYSRNPEMVPALESAMAAPPAVEARPAPKETASIATPERRDSSESAKLEPLVTTASTPAPPPTRPRQPVRRAPPTTPS